MAAPSSALTQLRPDLGSLMEFDVQASRMGFIGLNVLPVINVGVQAGSFGKITIESLLQQRDTDRAPGAGYNRSDFQFTTDSFATKEHGAEEPVDDREAAMYANYFDQEAMAAVRARDIVLRNFEVRVSAAVFNATTWTPTSLTNEWDDATNATPITDIEAAIVRGRTNGVMLDTLVVSWSSFRNLRNCDQVISRIQSAGAGDRTEPSDITAAKLAQVFDLRQVLVGDAQKQTAAEGQTSSLGDVWSNEYAAVCKVAQTSDIREPAVGRTFHYTEDGSDIGGVMESYRDETVRSDIIRARMDTQEKIVYTEALELLDNVTT